MDFAGFRITGISYRFQARFNRPVRTVDGDIIRLEEGSISRPTMVPGSVKMGIELLRPNWTFRLEGESLTFGGQTCGDYVRNLNWSKSNPHWLRTFCITYRDQGDPENITYALTPPFRPIDVRSDDTGNLCWP